MVTGVFHAPLSDAISEEVETRGASSGHSSASPRTQHHHRSLSGGAVSGYAGGGADTGITRWLAPARPGLRLRVVLSMSAADRGISEVAGAGILASLGVFSLIGATGSGWMCDRIKLEFKLPKS